MSDLYDGLEKSGYKINSFQKWDHLHNCTEFVVFDRSQFEKVIETLEKHKKFSFDGWFTARMGFEIYQEMDVAVRPSYRLAAEDMKSNPFLFTLLLGELLKDSYFDRDIISNSSHKEITLKCYDMSGTSIINPKKDFSPVKARELAYAIAKEIAKLSKSYEKTWRLNSEKKIDKKTNLTFELPHILVFEKPLYEATITPHAAIRLRDLEKRLAEIEGKNFKAEASIKKQIEIYDKAIANSQSAYFPCFKILEMS